MPSHLQSEDELDRFLARPTPETTAAAQRLESPVVILGANGKMGPSMAWLLKRSAEAAGRPLRVIAASRFSDPAGRDWFESRGIETAACDLLNRNSLASLPDSQNVIYLVGLKFGTRENPSLTWAANTLAPANAMERFPKARLVALSTGNVYPLTPVGGPGAAEDHPLTPLGEYPNAAVARERIFEYFSRLNGAPVTILRLSYALDLRYGVLVDLASRIWHGQPVDLSIPAVNCLWQGDANALALASFAAAETPPAVFNLTGPPCAVEELARRLGALLDRQVTFTGKPGPTALLSDLTRLEQRFGKKRMPIDWVLEATAAWVRAGGKNLGKPTHFEVRDGQY